MPRRSSRKLWCHWRNSRIRFGSTAVVAQQRLVFHVSRCEGSRGRGAARVAWHAKSQCHMQWTEKVMPLKYPQLFTGLLAPWKGVSRPSISYMPKACTISWRLRSSLPQRSGLGFFSWGFFLPAIAGSSLRASRPGPSRPDRKPWVLRTGYCPLTIPFVCLRTCCQSPPGLSAPSGPKQII